MPPRELTCAVRACCSGEAEISLYGFKRELFDGLEKAGFACDRRGDFIDHLLVRFGGHYMNHGASEKIVEGKVSIDALVRRCATDIDVFIPVAMHLCRLK